MLLVQSSWNKFDGSWQTCYISITTAWYQSLSLPLCLPYTHTHTHTHTQDCVSHPQHTAASDTPARKTWRRQSYDSIVEKKISAIKLVWKCSKVVDPSKILQNRFRVCTKIPFPFFELKARMGKFNKFDGTGAVIELAANVLYPVSIDRSTLAPPSGHFDKDPPRFSVILDSVSVGRCSFEN